MLSPELERAARATLTSFGATRDDLLRIADSLGASAIPTIERFRPDVEAIVPSPSRKLYLAGFDRLQAALGKRRLDDVTLLDLEQVLAGVLADAKANHRSVHGHSAGEHFVNATRFFFNAALRAGLIPASPAAALRRPKRPASPRRALSGLELEQLWSAVLDTSDDPELDELILAFARETACRKEGLLNLRVGDLNATGNSVVLDEKYGNTREIPVSTALLSALTVHADRRHPGCERVFHYAKGTCLTSRRIDTIIARARRRLPWMKTLRVSFHWIRHTTLSDISTVAGERIAQAYAGHADDAHGVTGVYTKPTFEMLAAAHAALFPDRDTPDSPSHARGPAQAALRLVG